MSDDPTLLEQLRARPLPAWYDDAKLGVFVHWTMASVPAFAPREHEITELLRTRYDTMQVDVPYTEWYENSLRFPESAVSRYHREHHAGQAYADFREAFEAAIAEFDPESWADDFAAAGARYVVLVTKHHDGYCLWPSSVANPRRPGWASPRDCVGDLARAVRDRGMRFGVYYSGGLDWTFDPRPIASIGDVLAAQPGDDYPAYAEAQLRELVGALAPDVLWNDISWPTGRDAFLRLVRDYYDVVPEGVINDRWITKSLLTRALKWGPANTLVNALLKRAVQREGADLKPPPSIHYDARTPEYTVFGEIQERKWECVRGMDKSFGYNRASLPEDFMTREDLVHGLIDIASKNGNLLINVGPKGEDATIPEPQRERLRWLGALTSRYGAALYGTRPWERAEGRTREGHAVRFTALGDRVYLWLLARPEEREVIVRDLALAPGGAVRTLGGEPLAARPEGRDLHITLPELPDEPAHAFALYGAQASAGA
jgi:alpha-L-fucosidase